MTTLQLVALIENIALNIWKSTRRATKCSLPMSRCHVM